MSHYMVKEIEKVDAATRRLVYLRHGGILHDIIVL
jgi:hypothetical protein